MTTVSLDRNAESARSHALLTLFLVTLLIPLSFHLGPLRLTVYRLYLLVAFLPFALRVMTGGAGRVTATDIFMALYGFWMFLSLVVVHGTERIAFSGISAVEMLGGYFAGRCLVQGPEDYRKVFSVLVLGLLCLMPFSLVEAVTGQLVIPDLLRPLGETPGRVWSAYGRLGLERVYSVFDHPILYGLFSTMLLASSALLARTVVGRLWVMGVIGLSTFLSLSAGPLLACLLQLGMLAWYWIFRGRWKVLIGFVIFLYLLFEVAANRSLASFVISHLTFNSNTGWIRLAVFDYAWDNVLQHPVFGLGFNDWQRPGWLTSSIDNFWLLNALRYGLPAVALVLLAFLSHFLRMGLTDLKSEDWIKARTGHLITIAAATFTLNTVHVWGSLSVFVMFFIGAGAWIYTRPEASPEAETEAAEPEGRQLRFSRFGPDRPVRPRRELRA